MNGTCTKHSQEFELCSNGWPTDGTNFTASYTALRYRIMQNALAEQNRTILYSLCDWGTNGEIDMYKAYSTSTVWHPHGD